MTHLTTVPSEAKLRVLAADSTAMTTQLLVDALGRNGQFHMIECPSDVAALLSLVRREKPAVAVISAQLEQPKDSSAELIRNIRVESPDTRVVLLLDFSEPNAIISAFRAGAQGVFCRTEPFHLLSKCIQCVAKGEVWASRSELQAVLEALAQPALPSSLTLTAGLLSARETDVVRCVAEGLTNREIAQRLKLTEHTVKNYLSRIFDKLGVSSRVEVLLYAVRNANQQRSNSAPASRRRAQPISVPSRTTNAPRGKIQPITS
ncbi:MAG TPA: response regulator transcription factor [Candidatus Eisenbacteria bacterium]|nr:response regulator transcription factor [Candidatus Eisenbacteria bacterium]